MRTTVEREVKLLPGPDFRMPALGRELPPRTFVSAYHDTPDLRLARRGITFRHRVEEGAGLWQLKLPRGAARVELEEPGPPAKPPARFLELLVAHTRGSELVRIARLRTRRRRLHVDGAEVVDDSVSVLEGQRVVARFRELEVELVDGDERALRRIERALLDAGAESGVFTPKLLRALEVSFDDADERPVGAAPLDAVHAALAEQYERLLAHDPGTRLGADPEDLHQMRVATRRARAFLRAAGRLLDRDWSQALRAELGWLGGALGPARDLDVLLEHLRTDVSELGEGADAAQSLLASLEHEHGVAREAALAALSDARYLGLLDRLEHAEPRPSSQPATTLAALWWDEFARTRKRFGRLSRRSSDEELHAARIQVKRARYAGELAAAELGGRGARFVDAAKRLQDVLGEHQDACVAEERIWAWAEREPGVEGVAERLAARERERMLAARDAWPQAWSTLEQRGRKARP